MSNPVAEILNDAPNSADIVCDRILRDYSIGLGTWSMGALKFSEHFYEWQVNITNAEKWVVALNLVRAELVYRKLVKCV